MEGAGEGTRVSAAFLRRVEWGSLGSSRRSNTKLQLSLNAYFRCRSNLRGLAARTLNSAEWSAKVLRLHCVEWGQAEGPASFLCVAFTRWSAAHCGHDPYRHDTTLSAFGCRSILVGWNCPGPSGLEIQEAALAISRSCNWLRCRFSVGTFQVDLSAQRRRCERQFSTVLIAANVTRQVRQTSL